MRFADTVLCRCALWIALGAAGVVHASPETPGQSFETCSLITAEYVTTLQLIDKGMNADQLVQTLPGLTQPGEKRVRTLFQAVEDEGLVATYSSVNSQYARCSRRVYQQHGAPEPSSREGHFYFCAGENKLRYQVLVAATLDANRRSVLKQLPDSRHRIAGAIFDLQKSDGTLAAFDALGDELKYCINGT